MSVNNNPPVGQPLAFDPFELINDAPGAGGPALVPAIDPAGGELLLQIPVDQHDQPEVNPGQPNQAEVAGNVGHVVGEALFADLNPMVNQDVLNRVNGFGLQGEQVPAIQQAVVIELPAPQVAVIEEVHVQAQAGVLIANTQQQDPLAGLAAFDPNAAAANEQQGDAANLVPAQQNSSPAARRQRSLSSGTVPNEGSAPIVRTAQTVSNVVNSAPANTEVPAANTQAPANTEVPAANTQAPANTEVPAANTQAPAANTQAPANTQRAPVSTPRTPVQQTAVNTRNVAQAQIKGALDMLLKKAKHGLRETTYQNAAYSKLRRYTIEVISYAFQLLVNTVNGKFAKMDKNRDEFLKAAAFFSYSIRQRPLVNAYGENVDAYAPASKDAEKAALCEARRAQFYTAFMKRVSDLGVTLDGSFVPFARAAMGLVNQLHYEQNRERYGVLNCSTNADKLTSHSIFSGHMDEECSIERNDLDTLTQIKMRTERDLFNGLIFREMTRGFGERPLEEVTLRSFASIRDQISQCTNRPADEVAFAMANALKTHHGVGINAFVNSLLDPQSSHRNAIRSRLEQDLRARETVLNGALARFDGDQGSLAAAQNSVAASTAPVERLEALFATEQARLGGAPAQGATPEERARLIIADKFNLNRVANVETLRKELNAAVLELDTRRQALAQLHAERQALMGQIERVQHDLAPAGLDVLVGRHCEERARLLRAVNNAPANPTSQEAHSFVENTLNRALTGQDPLNQSTVELLTPMFASLTTATPEQTSAAPVANLIDLGDVNSQPALVTPTVSTVVSQPAPLAPAMADLINFDQPVAPPAESLI